LLRCNDAVGVLIGLNRWDQIEPELLADHTGRESVHGMLLPTCACRTDNAEKLFDWVVDHSGKPFLFSTLLEEATEPRWKPEWASGNHLIADAFGRGTQENAEAARPA
jgi:hypothetical protein